MGWSWAQRAAISLVAVAGAGGVVVGDAGRALAAADDAVPVIVQTTPGLVGSVSNAVEALGGTPGRRFGFVNGFAARVPAGALDLVGALPGVTEVVPDEQVHLLGDDPAPDDASATDDTAASDTAPAPADETASADATPDDTPALATTNASDVLGGPVTMDATIRATGASVYRDRSLDGGGVDVALIDSGITRVPGLDRPGLVIDGPDLTAEGKNPDTAHRDLFGHGTHLSGIIAGADRRAIDGFSGVAPGVRLVNVKVADRNGHSSTSQVIAAIAWVIAHQHASGMNIRVLNLSFGTMGGSAPALDLLDQAVESAWRHGITVVVAAGNRGMTAGHLSNPARDPLVLAVGASDSASRTRGSDITLDFSSRGDGVRNPDLLAPGRSVVSLRDPCSVIDTAHPDARVGDEDFRGSGTSQAAAVVSGAVALVLEQHPDASPDAVKALLTGTAHQIPMGGDATAQGHGVIDLAAAFGAPIPDAGPPPLDPSPSITEIEQQLGSVTGGLGRSVWSGSSWSDGEWSGSSWS